MSNLTVADESKNKFGMHSNRKKCPQIEVSAGSRLLM